MSKPRGSIRSALVHRDVITPVLLVRVINHLSLLEIGPEPFRQEDSKDCICIHFPWPDPLGEMLLELSTCGQDSSDTSPLDVGQP